MGSVSYEMFGNVKVWSAQLSDGRSLCLKVDPGNRDPYVVIGGRLFARLWKESDLVAVQKNGDQVMRARSNASDRQILKYLGTRI